MVLNNSLGIPYTARIFLSRWMLSNAFRKSRNKITARRCLDAFNQPSQGKDLWLSWATGTKSILIRSEMLVECGLSIKRLTEFALSEMPWQFPALLKSPFLGTGIILLVDHWAGLSWVSCNLFAKPCFVIDFFIFWRSSFAVRSFTIIKFSYSWVGGLGDRIQDSRRNCKLIYLSWSLSIFC